MHILLLSIHCADSNNDVYDQKLAFKNNTPFIRGILKSNYTLIHNAEPLDITMPMYNLIE